MIKIHDEKTFLIVKVLLFKLRILNYNMKAFLILEIKKLINESEKKK